MNLLSPKKIIHGDCLEVMQTLPSKSVDMILCDLPYGITQSKWDTPIPLEKLWTEYKRIIKENGPIVLTACQPFTTALINSNPEWFKYAIVWEKSKATGFLNVKKRPLVAHEDILVFSKGTPRYFPQMTEAKAYDKGIRKQQTADDVYGSFKQKRVESKGQRYPRSVMYFKTAESEGEVFHKTQKPIALFEYLVKTFSKPGALVLDNCAGSGTTGIACINTGRNFILIEKESKYIQIIKKRLSV